MDLSNLKTLSLGGKVNKELSTAFHKADELLEEYRVQRQTAEIKYIKFARYPIINKILKNRIAPLRYKHEKQFRCVRELYQNSDEYKATRGY